MWQTTTAVLLLLLLLSIISIQRISASPGQRYILSPSSREVHPISIHRTTGNVTNDGIATTSAHSPVDAMFRLSGPGATLTFDFGQMTAGFPTLVFGDESYCEPEGSCSVQSLPGFSCGVGCNGLGLVGDLILILIQSSPDG
jgi:hypothetical protein